MNQLNEIYLALKNQIFEGMINQNKIPVEVIEGALAKIEVDLKTSQLEQAFIENFQMRQALQSLSSESNEPSNTETEEEEKAEE